MFEIGVKDFFVVCFLICWFFINFVDVVDVREGEYRYVIIMFLYLWLNIICYELYRCEILLLILENLNKLS